MRRHAAPGQVQHRAGLGYLSPVTDDDPEGPGHRLALPAPDQVGRPAWNASTTALRGKAGVTRYEVDNLGRVIGEAESDPGVPGSNLVTSIDARVQRVAEYELNAAMKEARQAVRRQHRRELQGRRRRRRR